MLLGAGAGTIVPVRVGARVVAILVAEAHVAAVVVVAAAPGETLNHRAEQAKPKSRHVPCDLFVFLIDALNPSANQLADFRQLFCPNPIGMIRQ